MVRTDADMIGHVAYALYKRDKLKFCESLAAKHGRPVNTQELEVFIQAANIDSRIAAYRSEAETALGAFAQEVFEVELESERARMDRELIAQLKEAKSWPRAVLENLIANMLAFGLTALLVVIVYSSRIGVAPLVGDILGYEVKEKQPASAPAR